MFGLPTWAFSFLMGGFNLAVGIFVLGRTRWFYRRMKNFFLKDRDPNKWSSMPLKGIALWMTVLYAGLSVCFIWLGIYGIGPWIGYWATQATGQQAADYVVYALSVLALIGISAKQLMKPST